MRLARLRLMPLPIAGTRSALGAVLAMYASLRSLLAGLPLSVDAAFVFALGGAAVANGLLWMFSVPFHEGPDEAAHFQVVRFIRDYGRLPVFRPDELWLLWTAKGPVETYGAFPPLPYLLGALASLPFGDSGMWGARAVSLVSYLGTVVLTYGIARGLFPTMRVIALFAATAVAFQPQFAFTAAYANGDALGVFLTSLLLYLLQRAWKGQSHPLLFFALGLTVGALLLTKYTFYVAAGLGLAACLLLAWWRPRATRRSRYRFRALTLSGAALISAALSSAWWFGRNLQLYGEVVPVRVIADAKANAGGNTLFVPAQYGIDLLTLSTQTDFWPATLKSFVGRFGFLSIDLDPALYLAWVGLAALAVVGLGLRLWRRRRGDGQTEGVDGAWGRWGVALFAAILGGATVLSAMAISAYGEYSPQGRYLFAALVPLAIALAAGWWWLGSLHPWLRFIPCMGAVAVVALNFVSLVGYVVPHYFGPAGDRILLQVDPQLESERIEIRGWSLAEGAVDWQPYAPGSVWDFRRPVDRVILSIGDGGGRAIASASRIARPDVAEFYGGMPRLRDVGFVFVLPSGLLPPGSHRLQVCGVVAGLAPKCVAHTVEIA